MRAAVTALWLIGGFALLLSAFRDSWVRAPEFVRLFSANSRWWEGGFESGRAYPTTTQGSLPADVSTIGSWLDGDGWQGDATTLWIPAPRGVVQVFVAGYPHRTGCQLWSEFRDGAGNVRRRECDIVDPHETWNAWSFQPPAGTISMRLVAEDRSTENGGWLAFSEPVAAPLAHRAAWFMAAQIATTTALTLILIWLPGILLMSRYATPELRSVALIGTGPFILAVVGGLVWILAGRLNPIHVSLALVTVQWLALGASICLAARRLTGINGNAWRIIIVSALVAIAGVSKASYSRGPEGELYGGTVYRTLAVGDRSDPRIPFGVVQSAAHHLSPASAEAEKFFTPWTFFSRGPLAGLIALPVSLVCGGLPPNDINLHPWQPFDAQGYAAYRIVLVVLGSMVVVALFLVLDPLIGGQWALMGAGLLALCPFGVHEVLFTWPKFEATTWLLLSFLLAHHRRPVAAGTALAIGFFFHPMSALWTPWLALWAIGRRREQGWRTILLTAVRFAAPIVLLVLPWMALGKLPSHLPTTVHHGQSGFIKYFLLVDYQPAPWHTWWRSRWNNFANTFLPLWLFLFHRDHATLSGTHVNSGLLVRFAFGWWNTLPLGAGIGLWATSLVTLADGFRKMTPAILLLILGPALLLIAYWGAASTGLMRECGHPLLAAIIGVSCFALANSRGRLARLVSHPLFPWLQLPETLLMLWLTTLVSPLRSGSVFVSMDPVYFVVNLTALASAALILSQARTQFLRSL